MIARIGAVTPYLVASFLPFFLLQAPAPSGDSSSSALAAVEIFAPGAVSTGAAESYPAFAPDGRSVYFKRAADRSPESRPAIHEAVLRDGVWTDLGPVPFSGRYRDADPFVSPDGQRLFFTSNRPLGGENEKQDMDIWVAARRAEGWGEPEHLGAAVNSAASEASPVVTRDGDLYFSSTRAGGLGSGDIYRSAWIGGAYSEPETLGAAVNSDHGEWNCVVSPDGALLIFEGSGREQNLSPSGNLYLSRRENGAWSKAVHLRSLSSKGSDLCPRISPDGRLLFFASNRKAMDDDLDIYQTELEPILRLGAE